RLDALIAYCEAPECRRRALLTYFGEHIGACGNCDVCLEPIDLTDGTEEGRQALDVIQRTGQRFGAAHTIDVLRGADTEKIRKFRHHALPGFGAGADLRKHEWHSILRQLVAGGYLRLDVQGFGGLSLTAEGRALLEGRESFRYRKDTVLQTRRKAAAPKPAAPAEALSPADLALLAGLKDLRLALARERDVPAYVVFHDRSLQDMARRRPTSLDAFAQVHGVGAAKQREFAAPFLELIASHGA
ncbi:MAG: RQC domain-containing protein, partial [Kiloniellales bacterium]